MGHAREPGLSTIADLAALGQLWELHRDRLLAFLESRLDPRLRQRVAAEEILHDAFLEAGRRWPAYQRGSPMLPYAWLYGIARDTLIARYRHHVGPTHGLKLDMPMGDHSSAGFGGQFLDAGTGPLTAAQRAELADRVRQALSLLPVADRDILVMRYFDQLTTREICDICNTDSPARLLTEDAANVRLFRALKKLRKIWPQCHRDSEAAP